MEEIWNDVKGYEGVYQVSNQGNVRRKLGEEYRVLHPYMEKSGYHKVALSVNGKHKYFRVHRLVAEAFLKDPKKTIDHINGNKQDDRVENLRYATTKENISNPNTKWKLRLPKSDEAKKRMSAAQKKRFAEHPEQMERVREGRWKNIHFCSNPVVSGCP